MSYMIDLPEGQTNSFQAQVLAVWPDARAENYAFLHWNILYRNNLSNRNYLGSGNTEAEAWQDAASKLPKGG